MRMVRRVMTLGALAALVAVPTSLPALAQSGSASSITHRQSVLTEVSPTGEFGTSRVFTQLVVEGSGQVEVELPNQSTQNLRRLTGFGAPATEGDTVIWTVDASSDGTLERSVADNTVDPPLSIDIEYTLDGESISPDDIVGRSGRLEATYTIRNLSAEPQDIRHFDGEGRPRVETIDVSVPMVGSLSMTLDPRFVEVDAPGAVTVGDGRGNTVVNVSLLLFSPIADEEQVVTWSAKVSDAVVPEVGIQVLPVNASSFGTIRNTEGAYSDIADGLGTLTTGAVIVDSNAQLLVNGAAQLFDGLEQLADGAGQLNEGLAGSAAPGSREIADGAAAASAGGNQLNDGLDQLAAGAGQLSAGLGQARGGAGQLNDGLDQLAAGAGQLSAGLGQARGGAGQLNDGLDQLAAGAGQLSQGIGDAKAGAGQLSGGLGDLSAGASQLNTGAAQLEGGLNQANEQYDLIVAGAAQVAGGAEQIRQGLELLGAQTSAGFPAAIAGLPQIADGIAEVRDGVYGPGLSIRTVLGSLRGSVVSLLGNAQLLCDADATSDACGFVTPLTQLLGGFDLLLANINANEADVDALVLGADQLATQLVPGLEAILANILAADGVTAGPLLQGARDLSAGAANLSAGVQQFQTQALDQLALGAGQVADGTSQVAAGAGQAAAGSQALVDGLGQLDAGGQQVAAGLTAASAGADDLVDGLDQLDDGGRQLAAGAQTAASGSGDLASGLVQLDDGGQQLAAGAQQAADGSGELADGLVRLADGTDQLADGLEDAADGSGQLADGAEAAADGGGQIADGTVALSEQGIGAIIEGASDAAAGPSLLYHHLRAADSRGSSPEALPYGTVEGADVSAVYQFEIAGTGTDEGPSTPVTAAIAVAALGAAGALGLGVRRRLV
jgi:putative membrane protein